MKKFASIVLISCLVLPFKLALANDNFVVSNIQISEVDENSTVARQKALDSAQKQAFDVLVGRLIGNEFSIEFDEADIGQLIESIEINDEVITNQNYAASYKVYFNESYTTYFLDNKILDAKEKVPSVLVIPVMNENGFFKLWQYGNLWKTALTGFETNSVLDIKIPSGDIDDLSNFVVENFGNYTPESIDNLKQTYGVDKIIVATVIYEYDKNYTEINLSLHLGELGKLDNRTVLAKKDLMPEDSLRENLSEYANLLYKQLDEAWVNFSTLSLASKLNKQLVVFNISRPQDLGQIYSDIGKLDFIKSFNLASVSTRYLGMNLFFEQSPLELVESLRNTGYRISRNGDHLFIIENR
jgi:hypothetical protein